MVSKLTEKTAVASKQNLKGESLYAFTMQLSQLVGAGVPLYQSLIAIEEQYRNEPYHQIILSLGDQIKAGSTLSGAMALYPASFSKLYRSMIMAGEQAGALNIVLDRLSHFLDKQTKLRKQIVTAMIYPGILASFCLLVIFLLLGFVVPSIEGIFADRKLNGFTEFILSLSHIFRDYWWLYTPLFFGAAGALVYFFRSTAGKIWRERHFLRLPLVRTLMLQAAIARFSRTMGTLQQGGVTMIDSLRIAREVMENVVLEEEMKEAEERIVEGSSLSAEILKSPWFPPMVSRMLAVGEDAGNITAMFNKIADIYEDEVEKSLNRLMAMAQPVILIVMGTIIGLVLLAILLPLTDVSAFSM
jgi:general secretion pathway protein F/type IV pilus assembly protein PilC